MRKKYVVQRLKVQMFNKARNAPVKYAPHFTGQARNGKRVNTSHEHGARSLLFIGIFSPRNGAADAKNI